MGGSTAAGGVANQPDGRRPILEPPVTTDRHPPPLLLLLCFVRRPLVLWLATTASHGSVSTWSSWMVAYGRDAAEGARSCGSHHRQGRSRRGGTIGFVLVVKRGAPSAEAESEDLACLLIHGNQVWWLQPPKMTIMAYAVQVFGLCCSTKTWWHQGTHLN
jgi:hypothetical protein